MSTTAEKLTYLNDTKGLLKDSINSLGGEITSQTTFRQYATELDSIYASLPKISGSGSNISLSPTRKGRITSQINGDTEQDGEPTPDNPKEIQSVTGLQNINVCGKNLFDKSSVITGKYYSATGTLTDFTNGYGKLINVIENTKYSLKIDNNYNSTIRLMIFVYDKDMNRLAQIRWSDTLASGSSYTIQNYTMPSGAKYITISVLDMQPTTENIDKIPIQLEVGTTATEYEAYQSQEYEINLGTIKLNKIGNYQDYITGTPDNWVINRQIGKVVLDGSESSWLENAATKGLFQVTLSNVYFNNNTINAISNLLIGNTGTNIVQASNYTDNSIATFIGNRLFFRLNDYTENLVGFKTFLASNNMIANYVLATETTEPITNTELIEDLNNFYNAKSYNGTTNITVEGDLPMILDVSAIKGDTQ